MAGEREHNISDREKLKGNKLEYAYQASQEIAIYPVIGSLIRALGKGWKILVFAPKNHHSFFHDFKSQLNTPQSVAIYDESSLKNLQTLIHNQAFDLVISFFKDKKTNQKIRNHPSILGKSHVMTTETEPSVLDYDLISNFKENNLNTSGVIAVTGSGKGKTTTALGIGVEAMIKNQSVAVVQWFKEKKLGALTWAINEHNFSSYLNNQGNFTFFATGAGFVGSPNMDRVSEEEEHKKKAEEGIKIAEELILSGIYSVIILDEFVDTLPQVMSYLPYPLLSLESVQGLLGIASRSTTKVIVTGRQVTSEWEEFIGRSILVSEVKHPWSSKKAGAVSGLDF